MAISDLKAQHAAIRAVAQHLLDIAVTARGYRATVSGLLHDLGATIDTHAAAERDIAPVAGGEALARDWRCYRTTWSTGRVAADWTGFVAATRTLMPRMLAHLECEEAALDAMAAR